MNTNKGLSRHLSEKDIANVYRANETPESVLHREHMTALRKLRLPIAGNELDLETYPLLEYPPTTVPGKSVRKATLRRYPICAHGNCIQSSEEIAWIIPRQRGGNNRAGNVIGSCRKCKSLRGRLLPKELGWKLKLPL